MFHDAKMSGRREWLARALDNIGAWDLILRARGAFGPQILTVVTYHRIQEPRSVGPFDAGVVDASPAQFAEQVELLARYFNLIGIDELLRYFEGGTLPANPAMITFDDGYRECIDVALPILERNGARAVFFIATHYVGDRRIYWWDHITYLVKTSTRPRLTLSYPRPTAIELDDPELAARTLFQIVKNNYGLDLDRFTSELAGAAGVELDAARERELADQLVMTWDQVRELRDAGMDVQSHTHSHRVLQTLSRADQLDELARSREILESELGEPIRAVAYPVGRSIAHDPQLRAAINRAGYHLGFSSKTGVNALRRDFDPLDVKRLCFDSHTPASMIRGVLAMPQLRY